MKTAILLLGLTVLTGGCALGTRVVPLSVPATTASAPPTKPSITVGPVTDARQFQNSPSDPSTPSINGDFNSMPRDQLSRMIGRQRNAYGKALGDIALPSGRSVESETQALVEQGLRRRGYAIGAPGTSSNTATVRVDQFWAWFSPGFWAVTFEARVTCTISLDVNGQSRTFVVQGYGKETGQIGSDANWQAAYTQAFEDFLRNFDRELAAAQL